MQATIAAWLMATLTPSAFMVALVQTASTAPTLLLGLVAGALADIADRRRIILITQIVLFTAAIVLGGMTVAGITGPAALLALPFLTGLGKKADNPSLLDRNYPLGVAVYALIIVAGAGIWAFVRWRAAASRGGPAASDNGPIHETTG